jgi:hypothetical protein
MDNMVVEASRMREVVGIGYSKPFHKWFLKEDFLDKEGNLVANKKIRGTTWTFEREVENKQLAKKLKSEKDLGI